MLDILLTGSGDLKITDSGDIELTNSVRQAILIRLRWFLGEWRFGPEAGLPYLEEILIKNPNIVRCIELFRGAILSVEEVRNVENMTLDINSSTRRGVLRFRAITDKEIFDEEVLISV